MGSHIYAGQLGPHASQAGLFSMYRRVDGAVTDKPRSLEIADVWCLPEQKHGVRPSDAIAFGMELRGGYVVPVTAGVMGGISAGVGEPGTHASVNDAMRFFDANVRAQLRGVNIADRDSVTDVLTRIDDAFRGESDRPTFSHVGSEVSVGVSMITAMGLSAKLGVPLEVVYNYLYNRYALSEGLTNEVRPITIPVNYSVVWEGGKHGAAKYLHELEADGVITDGSMFPARFRDQEKIARGDKDILLGMVPPQEIQIAVFTKSWQEARSIGIKLTKIYEQELKEHGIDVVTGAESGYTTKQVKTRKGELITTELILQILDKARRKLGDDARKVRYALDIAASEMYISELEMYYIGPNAAGNGSGLVNNEAFTVYKKGLMERFPFFSIEDWADERQFSHWLSAQEFLNSHIIIADDNTVSHADLILAFASTMNAHLQKPNQSAEERAQFRAVATSHNIRRAIEFARRAGIEIPNLEHLREEGQTPPANVVIFSHRGTRPADETYTARVAMAMGAFGGKWTLWGIGRGALITAMDNADAMFNRGRRRGVSVPYQGALVLDPSGPYANYGWAQRVREAVLG